MVLIFTENEELNNELHKNIENSRVVYYPDYILEEKETTTLITTIQPNKYNFKEFMFNVRQKNIQVILILEDDSVKELKDALLLGIYDIILGQFDINEVVEKIKKPNKFSEISKYIKNLLEIEIP